MAIYNYALLALLASGAHGLEDSKLTLGPDAIVQPKGGGSGSVLLAEEKKSIEINSFSWGVTNSGSSRVGSPTTKAPTTAPTGTTGLTAKGALGGSTGPTKPPLPTTGRK
jgi:hypothetical protein